MPKKALTLSARTLGLAAAEVAVPNTFESLLRRHAELLPEAQRAELNRLAGSRAAALRRAQQVAQR
ncbi:hypothetical protein SAMN05444365_104211 [Micromonospora pattaloongensis]|uniref:Uncharacterized protein n=1 Tax=Micromonospora pattaloongensis TaxID=405436 RepID=A0A1H3NX37_9ACTN|nr:hypothetical protein [Micromonospora pattaloongensis]SDY93447.1 hypothetical protein SAMN05444365_104211 [Micromonospora pattaloongensis]